MTVVGAHPARYSEALIGPMVALLRPYLLGHPDLYDPMAGDGEGLRVIAGALDCGHFGSEIEPEFIKNPMIVARDCRAFADPVEIAVTSPAYGNRMADQYLGTPEERRLRDEEGVMPRRRSYAIALGRPCSDGSGAALQWGEAYRSLHGDIYRHVIHVNRPRIFLVNITSHFRAKQYQPVAEWTLGTILSLGMVLVDFDFVETLGFRDGQNREDRVGGENLYLFARP